MGIKGLSSFISNYGEYICFTKDNNKRLNNIIIVDANQILFWICNSLSFVDIQLISYSYLREKIISFINSFLSVGFILHFYFDGKSSRYGDKLTTFILRQEQRIKTLSEFSINTGVTHYPKYYSGKPKLGHSIFLSVLKELNCIIVKCKGEADPEIAKASKSKNIYGILSDDSDFLLISGTRFIKLSSIQIENDKIYAKIFTSSSISKILGISNPNNLYLFSSFVGNDFTLPYFNKDIYTILGLSNSNLSPSKKIPYIVDIINNESKCLEILQKLEYSHKDFINGIEITKIFCDNISSSNNTKKKKDNSNYNKYIKVSDIPVEYIELNEPSISDLVEHLICSLYYLNYSSSYNIVTNIPLYRRIDNKYEKKNICLDTYIPSNYKRFITLKQYKTIDIYELLYSPLCKLKGVINTRFSSTLLALGNQLSISGLVKAFTLQHIVCSFKHWNNNISCKELTVYILFIISLELNIIPQQNKISKTNYPYPTARTITLHSIYTNTLSKIISLITRDPKCIKLESYTLSNGILFQEIYEKLRYINISEDLFTMNNITLCMNKLLYIFQVISDNITIDTLKIQNLLEIYLYFILYPYSNKNISNIQIVSNPYIKQIDNILKYIPSLNLLKPYNISSNINIKEQIQVKPSINIDNELPILKYKQEIINNIDKYKIIAIQGETGCGKSSKVPQFALEQAKQYYKYPKILITQPRRIAAISLAKRVASEIGCKLGNIVGYKIGQERKSCKKTQLLFVTTGWLLEKLIYNPNYITRCSHIILDEIHERSIDSDFLNLLIREIIKSKVSSFQTKIIIMSATFDIKMFVQYFQESLLETDIIPQLFVGVQCHHVEILYLDTFFHYSLFKDHESIKDIIGQCILESKTFETKKLYKPGINIELYSIVLCIIDIIAEYHKNDKTGNAILIFLPGIQEIEDLEELFWDKIITNDSNINEIEQLELEIFVLHSLIEQSEQMKVFQPLIPGITRIILATNIAESSVTLPQIRYVFDFGLVRQLEYDLSSGYTSLKSTWISKASAKQRSGRCGRLFPGYTIRIYPKEFYNKFEEYEIPEMLRLSLSNTILRLKALSENVNKHSPFHDPRNCLKNALQPPKDNYIDRSVIDLLENSVISVKDNIKQEFQDTYNISNKDIKHYSDIQILQNLEQEYKKHDNTINNDLLIHCNITILGKFLSQLPFDLRIGRLIALGLRCGKYILHCILIAVGLSNSRELFLTPYLTTNGEFESAFKLCDLAQQGRESIEYCLSDVLSVIPLFIQFCTSNKWPNGIHNQRLKKYASNVNEIVKRLESILPNNNKWLKVLNRENNISKQEIKNTISFEEKDINFLRLLLSIAFLRDGIVIGNKIKEPRSLNKFNNIKDISNIKNRVIVFKNIPKDYENYTGKEFINKLFPKTLIDMIEDVSFDNELGILFKDDSNNNNNNNSGIKYLPKGIRILSQLSRKGCINMNIKQDNIKIQLSGMRVAKMNWEYNKSIVFLDRNSIYTYINNNDSDPLIAIPGSIQYSGDNNTPRISRLTIIPKNSSLIEIITLLLQKNNIIIEDKELKYIKGVIYNNTTEIIFSKPIAKCILSDPFIIYFKKLIDNLLLSNITAPPSSLNENILENVMKRIDNTKII